MKTIDFETNKLSDIYEDNVVVVNEVLLTIMGCALLGYWAANAVMNGYVKLASLHQQLHSMRETRRKEREEHRKEREERLEKCRAKKEERLKKKQEEQRAAAEEHNNKVAKAMVCYENSVKKLPEDKQKEHQPAIDRIKRIMNGEGSKEDIEAVKKESNRELSSEEKKMAIKARAEIDKVPTEQVEEYKKQNKMTVDNTISAVENTVKRIEPPKQTEPKEQIVDMEVEDPKTGEKTKQKVHIGPQGGKYYWPQGSPHDADHKIYV